MDPIVQNSAIPTRHASVRQVARSVGLLGVSLLAPVCLAQAQDEPPAPPAQTRPLLTGPAVEPEATDPTLIRVGYDGRLQRIEDAQPEVAALELVELDDDTRARIDARLDERAAFLDRVVAEQYRTLLELYSAFSAGDQGEVIRLYVEFSSHLAPLFEGGGLAAQLGREMPVDARRQYGALLREYYQGVIADAMEHPEEMRRDNAGTPADVLRGYKVELLMQEVARSFSRIIQQKTDQLEEVLAALELPPDREAEIRGFVQTYGQELGLNPTPEQQRAFFARLMNELSPQERQRLMAWVLR